MSADAELAPSGEQVLGRYRVVRKLAKGGMGVVYLGRLEGAAGFAKPVVIKRILQDSEDPNESTARFIREAQILSNLQHPGIVGVLDFGEEGEGHAMILEYVNGYDLGRWLKYLQVGGQRLDWEEAVFIVLRVLEALSYAHNFRRSDGTAAQVLHRDISPGNVLLDVEGRVRLLDFGIARMAEDDQYRTQTGVLKGKVPFLAPELFTSDPPSAASDLYACGVVLYQMLAGSHPFTGENDSKLMWRIITEGPKSLSHYRSDLPLALEGPILTALRKDPEQRQASADAFAAELRQLLRRDETAIAAALREHVQRDFNGDMPKTLRLETLAERERAWRNVKSSIPPEAPMRAVERVLAAPVISAAPTRASQPTVTAAQPGHAPDTIPMSERATRTSIRRSHTSRPPRRADPRTLLLGALGIGVIAAGVAVAAMTLLQPRPPPPSASRFIVVESPDKVAGAPMVPAAAAEPQVDRASIAANAGATAVDPASVEPPPGVPARRPEASGAASLTRHFAQREGELQRCFERHAAALSGQPELSVDFDVAPNGKVKTATLQPASLAPTPLGQCLIDVARGTSFGAVGKSLRFSIPIRARSVNR